MRLKKQKKASWFPAPKKQKRNKKKGLIGLGIATCGAIVVGLMKPKSIK